MEDSPIASFSAPVFRARLPAPGREPDEELEGGEVVFLFGRVCWEPPQRRPPFAAAASIPVAIIAAGRSRPNHDLLHRSRLNHDSLERRRRRRRCLAPPRLPPSEGPPGRRVNHPLPCVLGAELVLGGPGHAEGQPVGSPGLPAGLAADVHHAGSGVFGTELGALGLSHPEGGPRGAARPAAPPAADVDHARRRVLRAELALLGPRHAVRGLLVACRSPGDRTSCC